MLRRDNLYWGGYHLWQDTESFCFSIDAVILTKFCRLRPHSRGLDVGCGNGVLPLLLKAQEPSLTLIGLELNEDAAALAEKNMAENHVDVSIIHGDMMEAPSFLPKDSFDFIVSNPPYEKVGTGRLPKGDHHAVARAEIQWDLTTFMNHCALLLKGRGQLFLIHRPRRLGEIMSAAASCGLEIKRLRLVQPSLNKGANLVLLEFMKGGNPGLTVEETLIVYDANGKYHPMMKEIFEEPK